MSLVAPGQSYWVVECDRHGIVCESADAALVDAVLDEHVWNPECRNVSRRTVFPGADQSSEAARTLPDGWDIVIIERDAPGDALQGRGGAGASRSVQRCLASLGAVPGERVAPQRAVRPSGPSTVAPQALGFRGRLTATSWEPPGDMRIEEWLAEVGLLLVLRETVAWYIGDCLLYGEARFGEMFSQIGDQWSAKTLSNWMTVAKAFPISRRRETLSWSHHAEIAALPPDAQDAWLDRAEAEGMVRAQLRRALHPAVEAETCVCEKCGNEHRTKP